MLLATTFFSSVMGWDLSNCNYVDDTWDWCRTGGHVDLPGGKRIHPGSSEIFDNPNSSRKWTWYCGNSDEKARIYNANKIVVSFRSNGRLHWSGYSCPVDAGVEMDDV